MKILLRPHLKQWARVPLILGLATLWSGAAVSEEPAEKQKLQEEIDGDKAFLIEWLGQPDDDSRLDEMHEEPEIQAIAERMPRAQARLRELEAKSGSTASEAKPKD